MVYTRSLNIFAHVAITLLLLALPAGTLSSRAQADDPAPPQELTRYAAVFAEEIDRIARERDKDLERAYERHIEALRRLEKQYQRAGDLKELLAVREEIARFEGDPAVASIQVTTPPAALSKLLQNFVDGYKEIQLNAARRVIDLSEKYIHRLDLLQKELTRRDLIDEAMMVLKVSEQVPSTPAVVQAHAQIESGGVAAPPPGADATTHLADDEQVQAEAVKAYFRGRVVAWNSITRQVTLEYDFRDEEQLADWGGGTIDELRECLLADREAIPFKEAFQSVSKVEYEASHYAGDGPLRVALGSFLYADVRPGAEGKAILHQGSEHFPLHASSGGTFTYGSYEASLEVEEDKAKWSFGHRNFPEKTFRGRMPTAVNVVFGHEDAKATYDDIRITAVLSPQTLRKIEP